MLKYKSGEVIKKSDSILIENGKTEGKVYEIIDTPQKQSEWSVNEDGVIIESAPFGLMFWASDDEDSIIFIKREK